MAGVTIKVDPVQMKRVAGEFGNKGTEVQTMTNEMMNIVTQMANIWKGDASQAYISRFKELEDDMQKMFRMIQEHAADLENIAQEFITAENKNTAAANALRGNVIQ